ncbi:MAG: helix-turn-helix domain-containing protein [Anaerolineales bacterium]
MRKPGVKHTTLTKIESNVVVTPSVQTVAKIAKALGVPMEARVLPGQCVVRCHGRSIRSVRWPV